MINHTEWCKIGYTALVGGVIFKLPSSRVSTCSLIYYFFSWLYIWVLTADTIFALLLLIVGYCSVKFNITKYYSYFISVYLILHQHHHPLPPKPLYICLWAHSLCLCGVITVNQLDCSVFIKRTAVDMTFIVVYKLKT